MNIYKMPASREMDELIATDVMGWQPSKIHLGFWATPLEDGCEYNHHPVDEWSPSTDIAAAWEVIEIFRSGWQGHAAACIDIKISDWVGRPDCQVSIFGPDIAEVRAEAYSICLAICRAALKAIMQGEGDA